jgi:transposase-like protein
MQASGHTPIWSGQRVERTNSRGYHTYVAPFKDWLIQQALQPGMSLAGLAMSNQVNANLLRRWVQRSGQPGAVAAPASSLLPVTIIAPQSLPMAAPDPSGVPVEIELHGAVVRVRDGVSSATLRVVLNCVRESAR